MKKFTGMFFLAQILILLSSLTIWIPALAQTNDPPMPEPLILTDEQGEYPLGLHLEILDDPSGELTIDDVSSPEYDAKFIPSQVEVPNYGFTNSAYWVRLRLNNQTSQTNHWLLEQGFANTQLVDLYTPLPDGEGFTVKQTGVLRPTTTRDVPHPRIILNLTIPPQSQQTYYLRFQNGASMTLPLTLWAQAAFLNRSLVEQTLMGIYYGVLIGLFFYNLFLLFSLREVSYLYFLICIAGIIIEESSYDGYLELYIIPKLYSFSLYYFPLAVVLLVASIVLFSDTFLELKTRLPKLHWVNLVILAIWGVLTLLIPFARYHTLAILMAPLALLSLLAVLIAGILSWMRGFRSARFFVIAWLGMIISLSWVLLIRLAVAPSTLFSENAYRLGILWMAVCWSIALADRINLLKTETENANRALRSSEHKLSEILEGLPLGVVVYGKDRKPNYANQRTVDILSNPTQGIQVNLSAGRTLEMAIDYFNLQKAGSGQAYPLENFPIESALLGEPANADDIEADLGGRRVPLEIWASPVRDDTGNIESAVVAFQDITQRKQAEAELVEYRKHLESLVEIRTAELSAVNEQLQMRLDWLSAVNLVNQIRVRSADFTQIYEKIIEIINNLFATHGSFITELETGGKQSKILAHSCRDKLNHDLVGAFTTLPEMILSDPNLEQQNLAYLTRDQLSTISGPMGMHIQDSKIQNIALVPLQLQEQALGFLGLEMLDEGRLITSEESDLLRIFSTDIAQLIEDSRLLEQSKALIMAEERNRLARDLHDSVTQTLFTASVLAQATPRLWDKDQRVARQNMEKLNLLIRGALAEMRSLLLELRSGELQNQTLGQLLATLADAVRVRTRAAISISIKGDRTLPDHVTLAFYRIAQEALNNTINHAEATQINMSLLEEPDRVQLRIRDDGRGFDPRNIPGGHMGVSIMLERAAQIGADLQIHSQPGQATEIVVTWSNKGGSSQHD